MQITSLSYIADDSTYWPEKSEKRLPDNQKMLPMWNDDASYWERVKRIGKRREYMFQKDWIQYCPSLRAWLIIRANFVHDWSSIPRALQVMTSPDGVLAPGAPGHDHGYRVEGLYLAKDPHGPFFFYQMSRLELDTFFWKQNAWYNGLPGIDLAAYLALRMFGGCNFKPVDAKTVDWSKPVVSQTVA